MLKTYCSLMAQLRSIDLGGSIPKNKNPTISNMNYSP